MIYCFHEIGKEVNEYCVSIETFKEFVKNHPKDEIHLDDGRKGIMAIDEPYLQNLAKRTTIFIVPNFVKNMVPEHENYSDFLDFEDIEKLIKLGFEIGSHSLTHVDITKASGTRWREELEFSKKWLQDRFQVKVEKFSWPYGKVTAWLQIEANRIYKKCYTLDSIMGIPRTLVLNKI